MILKTVITTGSRNFSNTILGSTAKKKKKKKECKKHRKAV
jgi:hypothetical protein